MAGSYVLAVEGSSVGSYVRELSQPRVVIGREAGDLIVQDARCSSTHAELLFDGQTVRFRDLGSTNGTLLNGARVNDLVWQPGTTLQIGQVRLTLREVRGAGAGAKGRTVAGNVPIAGAPYGYGAQGGPPAPQGGNYGQPPPAPFYPQAPYANQGAPGAQPFGAPAPKKGISPWLIVVPLALVGACGVAGAGALYYGARAVSDEASSAVTMTEPAEASVNFVWYAGEPGPSAKGGTSPARVRVAPNKTGSVSVGVSEEFAGGGGNQWRTATWLAAFNATRTAGRSLSDYEFNVHVGGHVDGPSAGMLTTATMLALIRGKALRADTTMTGTINPDGSAGPVGGIAQKMQGAKASGLARFGFPIGTRQHKDMQTGNMVDLVAFGQAQGLEVKELSDIYEAYEFLTGDTLARAEPIAESELEPAPQSQALLRAKVATWKARVERELGNLKAEAARTGNAVLFTGELLADADKTFEQAQRHERNGFMVPALDGYANTAIQIAAATRLTSAAFHIQRRNLDGLFKAVDAAATVKPEVESYGAQLELKAHGQTRGGQISTTYAFTHYVMARAAVMIGDDFLAGAQQLIRAIEAGQLRPSAEAQEALLTKITAPTIYYDVSRVYLDYAKDLQDLIVDEGTAPPMDATSIDRRVKGYASASAAVLAYFDALITDQVAQANNLSADEARVVFANREPDYYLARKANMLSEYTGGAAQSDGAKLMRFAAAQLAYLGGATLVNKWYSLSASLDKDGKLVLDNRRALTAQLELARRSAREAATRAKASAGFVPAAARLAYQTGNALREGSDEDKLQSLSAYWQATFWSEIASAPGGGQPL